MLTLGIETSCDETAVCLLEGRRVLAHTVASSVKSHGRFGGIVPEIASRAHLESLLPCLSEALRKARRDLRQVRLIAATGGPGLVGSLLVGASCAKSLAASLGKPLVFVDHVLAHAHSVMWEEGLRRYPVMSLVVSGGHTVLLLSRGLSEVRTVGKTIDDAAGEAFDKVAKMLGLGYPGGPPLQKMARRTDPRKFDFPRPKIREAGFDFSFSGLKTSVYYRLREMAKKGPVSRKDKRAVASAFQEAVCEVLVEKSLSACRHFGVRTLTVGGGVSANVRLRALFLERSAARGVRTLFPSGALCADNAIMIAALGRALYIKDKAAYITAAGRKKALGFGVYSEFGG